VDWLKHAVVFELPLGDAPGHTRARIKAVQPPNATTMFWVVECAGARLLSDGSAWTPKVETLIKHDVAKKIPERAKEIEDYCRRTYFETKEQALDTYVAWRHSQGDVGYRS
jgi:hypothetical protein